MDNKRVFKMLFAGVYPHYIARLKRKAVQKPK